MGFDPLRFQYFFFIVSSPIILIFILLPVRLSWKNRRSTRQAMHLFLMMITTSGWLIGNVLEQVARTPFWSLFFTKFSYPFITSLPVIWICFALDYAGKADRRKVLSTVLFSLVPTGTFLCVLLFPRCTMVWRSLSYVPVASFLTVRVVYGPWFWIHIIYIYFLLTIGSLLILLETLKRQVMFKRQAFWMIFGSVFPLLPNFIYVLHLVPGLVKDFTPWAFAISALAFARGIFKFSLFEVIPIARSTVVDHMKDGIIILDTQGRIIDINGAAMALLDGEELLGRNIGDLHLSWPELAESVDGKNEPRHLKRDVDGEERSFLVDYTPIPIRKKVGGWIIEMRDITRESILLEKIDRLAKTDELTGLPNRRCFAEIAEKEVTRSMRFGNRLAMALIDLDFFKVVNDTYGHQAGDEVLVRTAEILRTSIRDFDIPARIGGEEFIILMPETSLEDARNVGERIRKSFENCGFPISEAGKEICVTVSIGITCLERGDTKKLDELFREADKAMYRSKVNGRNRTSLYRKRKY